MPQMVHGQDICGTWWGNYDKGNLNKDIPSLKLEIQVVDDTAITGSLTMSFSTNRFQRYAVSGFRRNEVVYITEDSGVAHNVSGYRALRDYDMKIATTKGMVRLQGISRNYTTGILTAAKLPVWFEREVAVEKEKVEMAATVSNRQLNIIRTIEIDSSERDSIRIEVRDNARQDNDMVSICINDSLVLHKHTIAHNPVTLYTTLSEQQPQWSIRMVAESLGSMPPCTALMSVITSSKRHDIEMSSSYTEDSIVKIVLK